MDFKNLLKEKFSLFDINLSDFQIIQFETYFKLLKEWNEKFNLTTILSEEDVIVKHFLDSVLCVKNLKNGSKILDIGSGAGFPALPLKIVNDSLNITMIDSVNKKVTFLNEVIANLNLKNAHAYHTRAEDMAKGEYRESFDYVVSRAVASLNTLSEYCLPFVKINGYFVAYKSEKAEEEIELSGKAIEKLGGKIEKVDEIDLFGAKRKFIYVKKVAHTPNIYPRGKNKPRLDPLK